MKIELVTHVLGDKLSFHIRLIGSNGRCMMSSETYFDRSTARRAAKRLARRFKLEVIARYE